MKCDKCGREIEAGERHVSVDVVTRKLVPTSQKTVKQFCGICAFLMDLLNPKISEKDCEADRVSVSVYAHFAENSCNGMIGVLQTDKLQLNDLAEAIRDIRSRKSDRVVIDLTFPPELN